MKRFTANLIIKEKGTDNKIKIKLKDLTEEAIFNLQKGALIELFDATRKDFKEQLLGFK